MIRKQTWILLAVFIVVLAATIVLEKNPELIQPAQTPTPGPTAQAMMVDGWQSSDITQIEILDSQGSRLKILQNEEGKWLIDSPDGDVADAGIVEEIRTQITAARITAFLDPGYDLNAIGLSIPSNTLTIQDAQGRETIIYIGQLTPTETGYYVKVDNAAPAVVSKYAIDDILRNLQRDVLIQLETFPTVQP